MGLLLVRSLTTLNLIGKVYATARTVSKMKNLEGTANIELMALDVTVDANVVEVVESIVKKEGRIDILINNAGMACFGMNIAAWGLDFFLTQLFEGPILEVPVEQIKEVYDANILSVIRMSRAVLPHMAAKKSGTIVNISSIVGEM